VCPHDGGGGVLRRWLRCGVCMFVERWKKTTPTTLPTSTRLYQASQAVRTKEINRLVVSRAAFNRRSSRYGQHRRFWAMGNLEGRREGETRNTGASFRWAQRLDLTNCTIHGHCTKHLARWARFHYGTDSGSPKTRRTVPAGMVSTIMV
jgi:hypothetical protein